MPQMMASAAFHVTKDSDFSLRAFSKALVSIASSSTAVSGNFNSQPLKTMPEVLSVNKRMSGNNVVAPLFFSPESLVASSKMERPASISDLIQLISCPVHSLSFLMISDFI